jgi:hypothetical protein
MGKLEGAGKKWISQPELFSGAAAISVGIQRERGGEGGRDVSDTPLNTARQVSPRAPLQLGTLES